MPFEDDVWDAAAEEKKWRDDLHGMRHGTNGVEKAGLHTSDFYTACMAALDAATQFTKPQFLVTRAAFVAELRRLMIQPTTPSRPVANIDKYDRVQRRWLEDLIREHA